MAIQQQRGDRNLIPSWRNFSQTVKNGELRSASMIQVDVNKYDGNIKSDILQWEQCKTITGAICIVNSACVIGKPELGFEAAKYILQQKDKVSLAVYQISEKVIKKQRLHHEEAEPIVSQDIETFYTDRVTLLDKKLAFNDGNAITWIELALAYTILGLLEDADKAVCNAVNLAPDNRYILRSAVRFYVHKSDITGNAFGELQAAKKILRASSSLGYDPWLISTDIGLSAFSSRKSPFIDKGIKMIDSRSYRKLDTSELASAIATEELSHGKTGKAKSYFALSIEEPTDNSLAQLFWAEKKLKDEQLLKAKYQLTNAHEAASLRSRSLGLFTDAVHETKLWLKDQAFSTEPAKLGSYLASSLQDNYKLAVEFCDHGLRVAPSNFMLLNNKAYALALDGQVKQAIKIFNQIDFKELSSYDKVVASATAGLLHIVGEYEGGNRESGIMHYNRAVDLAKKEGNDDLANDVKFYKLKALSLVEENKSLLLTDVLKLKEEMKNIMDKERSAKFQLLEKKLSSNPLASYLGR